MTPLATESTTARATAACAGPNICTACLAPLIVTLLKRSVSGFAGRFGATTASSVVNPSLLFESALQKAAPAGPDFEPMIRSMCATSLPSPTRDSPRKKSAAMNRLLSKKSSKIPTNRAGVYHEPRTGTTTASRHARAGLRPQVVARHQPPRIDSRPDPASRRVAAGRRPSQYLGAGRARGLLEVCRPPLAERRRGFIV